MVIECCGRNKRWRRDEAVSLLVACEFSGIVRNAFSAKGCESEITYSEAKSTN